MVILDDCCSSNTDAIQQANMLDMANVGAEILSSGAFLEALEE